MVTKDPKDKMVMDEVLVEDGNVIQVGMRGDYVTLQRAVRYRC